LVPRKVERAGKLLVLISAFVLSGFLAQRFGAGGLWQGFSSALATSKKGKKRPYDLTKLEAVNKTLEYVRDRYVDPDRVAPRKMLLSALNHIQRDVAQVIVLPSGKGEVTVQVDTHNKKIRVDNVLGPWDVAAKLRQAFGFLQKHLKDTDVDLRSIEYAACNGILSTLDPHSTFLTPDAYKEMNLSTSGHFGGLGIVISIRDQVLTVIRPMPNTPASRAGLERHDRIMKINNESTLNMPLDDAVRRLRGKAGTKVTVWVEREGAWEGTKEFVLERERIQVASVLHKRLDHDIGYIRLKQFQATSTNEIRSAIEKMRDQGELEGMVLDLRGNPGGLLDQAAKVADLFVSRGVIVATVGDSEGREEKRASSGTTEPDYPLVVLVNGSSASASEIVAGALKNLDRALIVGQTTFGKGSVQLVFPDITPDKAALKLTISQYLTPGDKSIQGVGVTPHIELDPMTVDPKEMDLTVQDDDGVRERDLSQHLSNDRATKGAKPSQVVRYFLPQKEREEMRERGGELEDVFTLDFPTRFARDLARQLPRGQPASKQLGAVTSFIDKARKKELDAVSKELTTLDIDWGVPSGGSVPGPKPSDLDVTVKTDKPNDTVKAGDVIRLQVTVKNNGSVPVYRLRATTESDNPYFDEKELVFGKIEPGASMTATAPMSWCEIEGRKAGSTKPKPKDAKRVCKIPMDARSRSDGVKIHFDAAGGHTPPSAEIRPTIIALERPLFQYSYQISDDIKGNGDGLIQRDEQVTIYLKVKNVGVGRSYETQANLANRSGDGVLLRKGRFDISNMQPGDVRDVAFTFDVEKQLKENEVVLSLSVGDRDLREFASEKLRLPVEPRLKISDASGTVTAKGNLQLFGDVTASRGAFGQVSKDTALPVIGKRGEFLKVKIDGGRWAFVKTDGVTDGGSNGDPPAFTTVYGHAPPKLNVTAESMATTSDTVKVDVTAEDDERLLDMYMFVGSRKLHYQSNRNGADKRKASFSYDVPLQPGVNVIYVVARENPDTTTRRTIIVRRDAPDGSIMKTPKHQEDFLLEALGGK
jgi:carboxyl-terminal processing protease